MRQFAVGDELSVARRRRRQARRYDGGARAPPRRLAGRRARRPCQALRLQVVAARAIGRAATGLTVGRARRCSNATGEGRTA